MRVLVACEFSGVLRYSIIDLLEAIDRAVADHARKQEGK